MYYVAGQNTIRVVDLQRANLGRNVVATGVQKL